MSKADDALRTLRKEAGRKSILTFAKTYFPEHAFTKSSSFHREICDILIEMSDKRGRNLAVAAPRGHAKSTIVAFFYAVWSICYSKENYLLLVSATERQAKDRLADIMSALENNEQLMEDFPEVCRVGQGLDKYKWTQQEIETKNDIKVEALGSDQESRGFKYKQYRPTLIILDDIDGEKNTYSLEARNKLLKWFKGAMRYAGSPKRTNMVAIGTLLHPESLLGRFLKKNEFQNWNEKRTYKAVMEFSKRDDLWDEWTKILFYEEKKYKGALQKRFLEAEGFDFDAVLPKLIERNYLGEDRKVIEWFDGLDEVFKSWFPEYGQEQFKKLEAILHQFKVPQDGPGGADSFFEDNREAMLAGTKVLWEEEYDYYSLIKIKKIEGAHKFDAEMQNDPINVEDCYFNPEKFKYWTQTYPSEKELLLDLQDNLEIFGACDPSMGTGKKVDYSAIVTLARHAKEGKFYILDASIRQRTPDELIQDIVTFHRMRHYTKFVLEANLFQSLFIPSIQAKAALEGIHVSITPIHNQINKEQRIKQLENYISQGWMKFSTEHELLTEQLRYFPMGTHDDGPDALEMALRCANLTPTGAKWASLTSDHGSPELKILPENVRDPNRREYGPDYDIYNDKLKNDPWDDDD